MLFVEIVLACVTHFRRIHQFPEFPQFFLSMIFKNITGFLMMNDWVDVGDRYEDNNVNDKFEISVTVLVIFGTDVSVTNIRKLLPILCRHHNDVTDITVTSETAKLTNEPSPLE